MGNIVFFDSFKRNKESNNTVKANATPEKIIKLSREQIFNNLFEKIAYFKNIHGDSLVLKITSQEWRLFFNIVYKHFLENGIIDNYLITMEFVLEFVLSFPSQHQEGFTLESLVDKLSIPFSLYRVHPSIVNAIREELNDDIKRIKIDNISINEHGPLK